MTAFNNILIKLKKLAINFILSTPLRKYFFYRYRYNFDPQHLCFLCSCIEETRMVPGTIVEIGCCGGDTTVFLNKYMIFNKINKEYIAIDTFSGFTMEDVNYEVKHRGKPAAIKTHFSLNDKKWFDYVMIINNINNVTSIKADINNYNFDLLGRISFCLIDVDLYQPTKSALNGVFSIMQKGGIIVVDDCLPNNTYDGSLEAYDEFIIEHNLDKNIIFNRLGLIYT